MQYAEFRFAFYAKDFARSVRFYQEALGLESIGGWDRPDGKGALLALPGAQPGGLTAVIEIYGAAEGKQYSGPPPQALNLALRVATVDALEAAYRRLAQSGAELEGPPADRPWGHRSFVVNDPDGIPVHFYVEI